MTYTKYHTEGIVLKSFDVGEASRGYHIFTRDLGLVYAKAQSVRELKSKLRCNLQELSHAELSLVRAKNAWRVTHAEAKMHLFSELAKNKAKAKLARRVLKLLRRLLPPEERQEELYTMIVSGLSFIRAHSLSPAELINTEVLLVLRVLNRLGYLGGTDSLGYILASPYMNDMHVSEAGRVRSRAVYEINRALRSIDL